MINVAWSSSYIEVVYLLLSPVLCLMQGGITSWKVWRVSEFKVGEYGHGCELGESSKTFLGERESQCKDEL